jgi:GT2 family glycosyltransferase
MDGFIAYARGVPDDMRVGVVIATRDREHSLGRTLDRLAALRERPPIVVVDNGSKDGTARIARERGVRVLELGTNRGAAARTLGAEALDVPYVAFADDDSWWRPGALAKAGRLFDRHERLAVVAARILVGDEERLDPTCEAMSRSPVRRSPGAPGPAVLGFVACGAVVRRSAYLAQGGFCEAFGIGAEETLLAVDLAAAGWDLCYVEDVVAHHHPDVTEDRTGRNRIELRNQLWTQWLRRPARAAVANTARLLISNPSHAVPVVAAALRGTPWVLRQRRVVDPEVEIGLRMIEGTRPFVSQSPDQSAETAAHTASA